MTFFQIKSNFWNKIPWLTNATISVYIIFAEIKKKSMREKSPTAPWSSGCLDAHYMTSSASSASIVSGFTHLSLFSSSYYLERNADDGSTVPKSSQENRGNSACLCDMWKSEVLFHGEMEFNLFFHDCELRELPADNGSTGLHSVYSAARTEFIKIETCQIYVVYVVSKVAVCIFLCRCNDACHRPDQGAGFLPNSLSPIATSSQCKNVMFQNKIQSRLFCCFSRL